MRYDGVGCDAIRCEDVDDVMRAVTRIVTRKSTGAGSLEKKRKTTKETDVPSSPFSIFSSAMLDRDCDRKRIGALLSPLRARMRKHNCRRRKEISTLRVESMLLGD